MVSAADETSPPPEAAPANDFPFYAGAPVALSAACWGLLLAAVAAGFAELTMPWPGSGTEVGQWAQVLLFPAIPLAVLAAVAGRHWLALLRPLRWRDPFLMLGFALLNIAVAAGLGLALYAGGGATVNPAVGEVSAIGGEARLMFFARTVPQLFGEELLTLLPFLALLAFFAGRLGWSRRQAILGAWLLSSLLFGLLHLPTYRWNFLQCIVVIGSARLVLTGAYLLTKNIVVSTGAHILGDWLLLGVILLAGSIAAAPA
jgi:membrane protease YdiL (CAAX protease family)